MCHGFFDAVECLNVSLEVDLVVCYGTSNFQLVTLISCPANLQTPPTFAPYRWNCTWMTTTSGQQ